jgi:plasmid stabilization system protein ParE
MASKLRFKSAVAEDISAAAAYYDGISLRLGNRFRSALKDRFEVIRARPNTFGFIFPGVRATLVEGFPYIVFFESDGERLEVLAVLHSASDPEKWQRRAD